MLDPVKGCRPEIPTRQMLWLLTVICLQNLGDYWIKRIRPGWTEAFAGAIDNNTDQILGLCTGVKMESWPTHAQEPMRLLMNMRGRGLRQATDRRHAKFVGAMAQSIPRSFNRKDSNGNEIGGRLPMPKLNELFGEDSFDSPMHNPWEILIGSSREHHCLSNGLQHAWSHLQNSFQEVATNEQKRDDTLC